jgi:hypothetical protein
MEAVCKNITKVSDIRHFELQIYIILLHSLSRNFVSFFSIFHNRRPIICKKKANFLMLSKEGVFG